MFFDDVEKAPPDPIFGIESAFSRDPRKNKVNLAIGIYKDEHLLAKLFPSVQKALEKVALDDLEAQYLPIDGYGPYKESLFPLVLGGEKDLEKRTYTAHTVGGTGALRIGADFLFSLGYKEALIPNESWPNHTLIFSNAGMKVSLYPYYDEKKKSLCIDRLLSFFQNLPKNTLVILHPCCHNPSGLDPKEEDWKRIAKTMRERQLFPFFDFAYQGFGKGVEEDRRAIEIFLQEGLQTFIAYSCSKNFSMYRHRVGAFFAVCSTEENALAVGSQIKRKIRSLYSNPASLGARIVYELLRTKEGEKSWRDDVTSARMRIQSMRSELIQRLSEKRDFSYLKHHLGMFSFLGISAPQVEKLVEKYGVYVAKGGRINVAGLSSENIEYVAESILRVL